MTRFVLTLGCFLIAFALVAERAAVGESAPAAEEPEAAAENSEPAAEKSEPAAEKSEPAAEKSEPAEEKPESGPEKSEAAEKEPAKAEAKPQPQGGPSEAAGEKPDTHTVKPELLKVEVSLSGNFEAQSVTEIVLRPEAWANFKVLKAVEHGAQVERGDSLVQFELEDIDEAIADQRSKLDLSKLAIQQSEKSLAILEATTPLDLTAAKRAKLYGDEDFARFLKIDRPMSEKVANFDVEMSEAYLEYQQEELRQLEKMYEADDLTEETEEIVLKRQRDAVKRAEFFLEQDKLLRDRTLQSTLPRREEGMKESTIRDDLTLDEANATLPLALQRSRLELEKLKAQHHKDEDRLEKLEADRAMMEVKAPSDGVVYYGRFNRGEWSGAAAGAEKLRLGGSVTANDVFLSIVKPRPLVVRVNVPEKEIHQLHRGLKGEVRPTGYPEMKLAATVAELGAIPFNSGSFEARLKVSAGAQAQGLVPGMSCSVKFVPYLNRKALTVPPSAVHTDELDDQKHFVMQVTEDGKQRKRRVTIGKKTETQVEILVGLEEGDEVLKQFPKDKS